MKMSGVGKVFVDEGFYEMDFNDHKTGQSKVDREDKAKRHSEISRRISEQRQQLIDLEESLTESASIAQLSAAYQRLMH